MRVEVHALTDCRQRILREGNAGGIVGSLHEEPKDRSRMNRNRSNRGERGRKGGWRGNRCGATCFSKAGRGRVDVANGSEIGKGHHVEYSHSALNMGANSAGWRVKMGSMKSPWPPPDCSQRAFLLMGAVSDSLRGDYALLAMARGEGGRFVYWVPYDAR
jgi:hypothetical protein